MTRNTLTYHANKEVERHNRVTEEQKQAELAEIVANNLRNYRINVSKNQIQKLANDQLDAREAKKLEATIHKNLSDAQLRYAELAERTADNAEKRRLEKQLNEIKEMDALLQAAKATGKTPGALLVSWITNQANLSAFGGKNVLTQLFGHSDGTIYDGSVWSRSDSEATAPALEYDDKVGQFRNYDQRSPVYHGHRTRAKGRMRVTDPRFSYSAAQSSRRNRKYEDENEIPTDFSNSRGPGEGVNNEKFNEQTKTYATSGNGSRQSSYNNEGPGSNISESNSGRAKVIGPKQQSGPGIGLAFS